MVVWFFRNTAALAAATLSLLHALQKVTVLEMQGAGYATILTYGILTEWNIAYCTISINLSVMRHSQFWLTTAIIFLDFSGFWRFVRQMKKVTWWWIDQNCTVYGKCSLQMVKESHIGHRSLACDYLVLLVCYSATPPSYRANNTTANQ